MSGAGGSGRALVVQEEEEEKTWGCACLMGLGSWPQDRAQAPKGAGGKFLHGESLDRRRQEGPW